MKWYKSGDFLHSSSFNGVPVEIRVVTRMYTNRDVPIIKHYVDSYAALNHHWKLLRQNATYDHDEVDHLVQECKDNIMVDLALANI